MSRCEWPGGGSGWWRSGEHNNSGWSKCTNTCIDHPNYSPFYSSTVHVCIDFIKKQVWLSLNDLKHYSQQQLFTAIQHNNTPSVDPCIMLSSYIHKLNTLKSHPKHFNKCICCRRKGKNWLTRIFFSILGIFFLWQHQFFCFVLFFSL